MATIYRGSPGRFTLNPHSQSHYKPPPADASALQMQMRYSTYSMEPLTAPLPANPPPLSITPHLLPPQHHQQHLQQQMNESSTSTGIGSSSSSSSISSSSSSGLANGFLPNGNVNGSTSAYAKATMNTSNYASNPAMFANGINGIRNSPFKTAPSSSPVYHPMNGLTRNTSPARSYNGSSMMDRRIEYSPPEMLLVSPGLPTPLELSIYENKQPTGFLHVTSGNQTVEFLDGVANLPPKRM